MLPDALQTKEPMFPIKRPIFRHIPPQNGPIAADLCRLHPIAAGSPDNAPDKGPDPPEIAPDEWPTIPIAPDCSRLLPFRADSLPYFHDFKTDHPDAPVF